MEKKKSVSSAAKCLQIKDLYSPRKQQSEWEDEMNIPPGLMLF